jgi:tetratricopeptide (TPR) repeat protein
MGSSVLFCLIRDAGPTRVAGMRAALLISAVIITALLAMPMTAIGLEQSVTPLGFTGDGQAFVYDVTVTGERDETPWSYTLRRAARFDGDDTESWRVGEATGPVPGAWDTAGSTELGRRVVTTRRVAEVEPRSGTLDGRHAVVTGTECLEAVDARTDACPTCVRRDSRWRTVWINGDAGTAVTLGDGTVLGGAAPAAALATCPTVETDVFWSGAHRIAVVRHERGASTWDTLSLHDLEAPGAGLGAIPVVRFIRADDRAGAARRLADARAALPDAVDRSDAMLSVARAALDAGDLALAWDYYDAAHTLTGDDDAAVGRALAAVLGGTETRDTLDRVAGSAWPHERALAAWLDGDAAEAMRILDGLVPVELARRLVAFDLEAGIEALGIATADDPSAPGADELFDALLASGDHERIGPWIPQTGLEDPARLARLLRAARAVERHADVLAIAPPAMIEHFDHCAFYEVQGLAWLDVGETDRATPWLTAAVACDPDAEEAIAGLALALHIDDAFDAAATLGRRHLALGPRAGDAARAARRDRSSWIAMAEATQDVVLRHVGCVPSADGVACSVTVTHAGDVSVDPVRVAGWLDGADALLFDDELGALAPGQTASWLVTVPGFITTARWYLEVRPEDRRAEATAIAIDTNTGANITDLAQSRFVR